MYAAGRLLVVKSAKCPPPLAADAVTVETLEKVNKPCKWRNSAGGGYSFREAKPSVDITTSADLHRAFQIFGSEVGLEQIKTTTGRPSFRMYTKSKGKATLSKTGLV
jgi:hypothetical protein